MYQYVYLTIKKAFCQENLQKNAIFDDGAQKNIFAFLKVCAFFKNKGFDIFEQR